MINIENISLLIFNAFKIKLIWQILFWKCELEMIFDCIVNTGFYFLWSLNVVMYFRRSGIWFEKVSFLRNPYNASCYAWCWKLMWNYTANHLWMIIGQGEFVRLNTITIYYYDICKSNSFKSWLLRSQPGLLALLCQKENCVFAQICWCAKAVLLRDC